MTREDKEALGNLVFIVFVAFVAGAMVDSILTGIHPNLPISIPILGLPLYYYLQWRLRH